MELKNLNYTFRDRKLRLLNQPFILFAFVLIFFGAIISRLFWLQIINSSYYKKLSDENRILLVSIPPIRGRLLDRNNKVLVDNRLLYSLSLQPRLVTQKKWKILRNRISDLLDLSTETLDRSYNQGLKDKR